MKVSELVSSLKPGELMSIEKEMKAIPIVERDPDHPNMSKYKKMYLFGGDEIVETIDVERDVEHLVGILAEKVDAKELIRQQLGDRCAMSIHKMAEVLKKHPEVHEDIKPHRGCLYLQIPNPEPGEEDFKLYLRDL
jgi:hypothetical protein